MANKPQKAVGICKVGDKGQIVIPANIRKMFNIEPGESLIILADIKKGVALLKADAVQPMVENSFIK